MFRGLPTPGYARRCKDKTSSRPVCSIWKYVSTLPIIKRALPWHSTNGHDGRCPQDHSSGTPHLARATISLEKLSYLPSQATVRYTSEFNPAIGNTLKTWDARDFIAAASLFIPPQGVRLIRYYGLYASRSRWRWPQWAHLIRHAPEGWKQTHGVSATDSSPQSTTATVPEAACRSAWARLIAKAYEVDAL